MGAVVIQCPRCAARLEVPEADHLKSLYCDRCGVRFSAAGEIDDSLFDPDQLPPLQEPTTVAPAPVAAPAPGETPALGPALPTPPKPAAGVWQPGQVILDLYEVKQVHESGGMGLV